MTATITSSPGAHDASVATEGAARAIAIPPKEGAPGSSASGGELLMLAIASCYGNDVFREAAARGIPIERVEVTAEADFPAAGRPGEGLRYRVRVVSPAPEEAVRELLAHTDAVAEIHATVRRGTPIELAGVEVAAR
jgi:uncharacterized OsmC-like protein